MTQLAERLQALDAVSGRYEVILCDVWGVLHNGVLPYAPAYTALQRARAAGRTVILVTNAPRPHPSVEQQLSRIGVPPDAYDAVVTSGDVTRELIAAGPRKVFHIGEERDLSIFDGLDVELVEEREAGTIVCTGLRDDETETPDDYRDMLRRLRARDLPFVCANPDIVVERGGRLVWCAGALARDYALLGGRTLIAGKPHKPIYDAALSRAGECRGAAVAREHCLAVGDGILTDVKGASNQGIDVLFIADGIHAGDYSRDGRVDPSALSSFLDQHGERPVAWMERLK